MSCAALPPSGSSAAALPIIDVGPLLSDPVGQAAGEVARAIDEACRSLGFFCVRGHGVPDALAAALDRAARRFFALPREEKARVAMSAGGRAWRGWFPLGGELTSGVPDGKEGYYFGAELDDAHALVAAGVPLHGRNLFPQVPAELGPLVLEWIDQMTSLGHVLMRAIGAGLGLAPTWFDEHLTGDPTVLFRIFRYPPTPADGWGVAEHTDYGLLTILAQDDRGGLQVRTPAGWIEVEPTPGVLVCNVGDMLERMTGGRYRSTPHRVRNAGDADRLSFPFFFDPAWGAEVRPLPLADAPPADDSATRWDGTNVFAWQGTYGDYLLAKVAKVFPVLNASL
jgi:isopenicillin N synthase-like dioxygenase